MCDLADLPNIKQRNEATIYLVDGDQEVIAHFFSGYRWLKSDTNKADLAKQVSLENLEQATQEDIDKITSICDCFHKNLDPTQNTVNLLLTIHSENIITCPKLKDLMIHLANNPNELDKCINELNADILSNSYDTIEHQDKNKA